jgi:hypothetical protein
MTAVAVPGVRVAACRDTEVRVGDNRGDGA